jgi:hypothetical protein
VRASDIVGVAYVGAITAFIVFQNELFISLTARYPYPMGFAKIALLATFGGMFEVPAHHGAMDS